MFELSLILVLAWGALAFGAEYAWAYGPLLVLAAASGVIGLRRRGGAAPARMLLAALLLILLACSAQVLVPAHMIPGQGAAVGSVDFGRLFALVTMQHSPEAGGTPRLSIAPDRTSLGMAFLAVFTLLLVGSTHAISTIRPKRLVRGIVLVGVAVAFAGMIQNAVRAEMIYGFWLPPRRGGAFAPFINENHFAGWMAMVLSLTIGSFAGDVASALKDEVPRWRDRILWLSSRRASEMFLTAFAAGIMALSMVLTFSRGGLIGLLAVSVLGSSWMLRQHFSARRAVASFGLIAILIFAATWGDAEKTIDQFSGASETLGGREQIWQDTWQIVEDYPFTGTGLNTYGIAMLHYQTAPISTGATTEAHNDYLQLAAEGGLLLGIPIIFALGVFVREVWRRFKESADDAETYWLRAGAVTGLSAIALMEIFDFTLQMPGAAAMLVVLAAIAIHKPNYLSRAEGRRR